MKKFFVLALALLLAVPAISYAGSVTSRWDVTIGGYIKFDLGWMSQGQGIDYRTASRESSAAMDNLADEYDNLNWFAGESRFSFAIKGPDAWSAKTSAFLEGDFRGVAGSNGFATVPGTTLSRGGTSYFTLRHAFMTFAWPKTQILMGHTWQPWGLLPSFNILAFSENHFMKGATRVPQIRITQNFTKEFSMQFAVAATNQTLWGVQAGNYVDDTNRSDFPDTSLEFVYRTDRCGKIGPWMLQFGLGGLYGQERVTYGDLTTNKLGDDRIDRWGASFWGYIPIIPEKKGNKTNALGFTWNVFAGQGLGSFLPAYPANPYIKPSGLSAANFGGWGGPSFSAAGLTDIDAAYPTTVGGWAQATFYFADNWFTNVLWGYETNNLSKAYRLANINAVKNLQNFIINLMYDPNPAIRLALEYTRITTSYARASGAQWTGGKSKGSLDAVRFGAYYFF